MREDTRSMRDRMLAGELYIAEDPVLEAESNRARRTCWEINHHDPTDHAGVEAKLRDLMGSFGAGSHFRPPVQFDYGYQTFVGERVFANFGLIVLDVAEVRIGDDVQIAPNVQLLTATHPLEATPRRDKWESAAPITIGNNVWLGGGVIVCPGVSIGDNTVVAAGSVVTKDLPADVVAAGVPARVLKDLPEE